MTDYMQFQHKTVGQSVDTPTPVISPTPVNAPTTSLQLAPEPPAHTESAVEQTPELTQEPPSSFLNHDFGRLPIFAKLSVSQPNDPYEQEADRVAAQVMRMPNRPDPSPSVQGFAGHNFGQIALSPELEPINRIQAGHGHVNLAASITSFVQRDLPSDTQEDEPESTMEANPLEAPSTEEEQKEELLQTKSTLQRMTENTESEHHLEQQLAQSQGGGSPLPDETRTFMESRFGADFSQVRVHTDAVAAQMNQALQAQAFTHGQDIYFGADQSPGKNDLTAHELTHTIQQTGQPKSPLNSPLAGDFEQFGSASHHWGATSPNQIQKQPISVAQAFSIQKYKTQEADLL